MRYTWPVFALVTFGLTIGYLPGALSNLSPFAYGFLTAFSTLLLLLSLLVHELSHSLVARARGIRVNRITLFILGGYSEFEGEAETPADEFLIFFVGPMSSLALAGLFWLISAVADSTGLVFVMLPYLAMINLVIAAINLMPGLPLDGGRVFRAMIWKRTGSARRATVWASRLGQGLAAIIFILGIAQLAGGGYLGGLWNLFIGWFLNGAAVACRQLPTPFVAETEGESLPTQLEPVRAAIPVRVEDPV